MSLHRRLFLLQTAAAGCLASVAGALGFAADQDAELIDTHQHLWDLSKFRLPWLEGAADVLQQNYRTEEYLAATRGLRIRAIYMEVDVAPEQHVEEAQYVIELARDENNPTIAATIGGRPAADDFAKYLAPFRDENAVKGVRQVLHGASTPAGYCLQDAFVRGVQLLGEHDKHFDLCMRPGELSDGVALAKRCPGTRFVLDHCGNADPKAFGNQPVAAPSHEPDAWRRDIESLAKLPNVICKISGIVASAPRGWTADDLAPIVNHCLDSFGPDRVVFGSDWPVCLLGAELQQWVAALRAIVSQRPAEHQRKLWRDNAVAFYGL
jgi:L-fuconolactonase